MNKKSGTGEFGLMPRPSRPGDPPFSPDRGSGGQPGAPFCDVCGHITVENGAAYKCRNCGNTMDGSAILKKPASDEPSKSPEE